MNPENIPAEMVEKAARRFLATPGDQPDPDREQEWAEYLMRHVLAEVFNEIWGGGYAAAVHDVDLMGARAHAWDEAVAMCCAMAGLKNVNWPNKYRETGGAS